MLDISPEPKFSDEVILRVFGGTELIIIEKLINENEECWYKVKTPNGLTGWVYENWISSEPR
jgi:hypothetical protein